MRLERTPRELFAAPSHKSLAYLEGPCPISANRFMLAPTTFARMVEALQLKSDDTVLVVGGMNGYSAAILSQMASHVTLLDSDAALTTEAGKNFQQLGIKNVTVRTAAFDRQPTETYSSIFVEAAIAQIPETLAAQLVEGGRMVAIVGGSETTPGVVMLATKLHGTLSHVALFEAAAAYLPGMAPHKDFSF